MMTTTVRIGHGVRVAFANLGRLRDRRLKQLPPPDNQMRAASLPGRISPAVGNHEVWDDSDVQGLLQAFPYLKQFGVSDKRLIYEWTVRARDDHD